MASAPAVPPAPVPGPPLDAGEPVALDPASGDWLHRRAAAAVGLVSYPWERLGYEVVFHPARDGIRGRTVFSRRQIEVYVRPSDPVAQTAFDLAHELAHAFDWEHNTAAGRAAWRGARALDPRQEWFGCNACDDLATPAGDFAESFAAWQVAGGRFSSRLGASPDEAQRALLAELTGLG